MWSRKTYTCKEREDQKLILIIWASSGVIQLSNPSALAKSTLRTTCKGRDVIDQNSINSEGSLDSMFFSVSLSKRDRLKENSTAFSVIELCHRSWDEYGSASDQIHADPGRYVQTKDTH